MEFSGLTHQASHLSANKCLNANISNNCWHFKIYEQDKFHAQLSCA